MSTIVFETANRTVFVDGTGHVFINDKHDPYRLLGRGWDQVKYELEREQWLIEEGWL